MNAAFFARYPRSTRAPAAPTTRQGVRRVHRWVATFFTLTVAANFAAMPWGPPPAWIIYAPLPPLLILLMTGLRLLVAPWIATMRATVLGGAR